MPLSLHSTGNASENRVRRNNAHFTWRNRTRFVRVIATEVESKLIRLPPVEFAKHELTVSLSFQIEFRFDEHEKVRTILIRKNGIPFGELDNRHGRKNFSANVFGKTNRTVETHSVRAISFSNRASEYGFPWRNDTK